MRLIDKTRFAISTEETRYYLTGIYLHTVVEAGRTLLRAVATDGHRLALAEMPAPEGAAGAAGRDRAAQDRFRRRGGCWRTPARPSTCSSAPRKSRFDFGRASLTSKVIDGSFPDYTRVIPRENHRIMTGG